MTIHPTAIVEDGAHLGAGVEIGPFCIVGANAVLGDGVRLLSHVVRRRATPSIGARTRRASRRGPGRRGADPRRRRARRRRLIVGEDCVIREHVTMNLGSARGGGLTSVGARGYFMAYSHVGHDCHVGDDVTFANGAQLGGHVEIGDGVIMGGLSAVQQFGRVGQGRDDRRRHRRQHRRHSLRHRGRRSCRARRTESDRSEAPRSAARHASTRCAPRSADLPRQRRRAGGSRAGARRTNGPMSPRSARSPISSWRPPSGRSAWRAAARDADADE